MLIGFVLGAVFMFVLIFGAAAIGVARDRRRTAAAFRASNARAAAIAADRAKGSPAPVRDLDAAREARRRARNVRKAAQRSERG